MTDDKFAAFKEVQKQSWSSFAPLEMMTTIPAAKLVNFARIQKGANVLDVGCGTGVVAITAARFGANVWAMDLTPTLIERAKANVVIANLQIDLKVADVEFLPYADNQFDVVLSQFGHMFAPRPEVAIAEMLRVLKPGGTLAFSTWPKDLYVGQMFSLISRYSPPPEGVSPPPFWGDPTFVRQQLGDKVTELVFTQGKMRYPALSLGHYLHSIETTIGPVIKLVQDCQNDPERLNRFRQEIMTLVTPYYQENHIHQNFLITRARKK